LGKELLKLLDQEPGKSGSLAMSRSSSGDASILSPDSIVLNMSVKWVVAVGGVVIA